MEIGNRLARGLFTGVFVLIATGTLLVGLRFGYGIERFIVVQRVIPLFVGPSIYLGFCALMYPASQVHRAIGRHLGVALAIALLPQITPQIRSVFDVTIGISYLYYCTALLLLWRKGVDGLDYAPLEIARGLRLWMLGSAAMLAIMLVFNSGIAISFAMQRSDNAIRLITYGSVISMIALSLAIIVFANATPRRPGRKPVTEPPQDKSVKLEQSARSLLMQSQLYLDTNLTLERLAKRLHVPARSLSEAINQTQKMNVSQYVNGFRLQHAAGLLQTGDLNVVQVMEQSGFLTRSNFYREFERVYALSPIEYRNSHLKRNPET